jgi:hypothetical protein
MLSSYLTLLPCGLAQTYNSLVTMLVHDVLIFVIIHACYRKTKHSKLAKDHLKEVSAMLGEKDKTLTAVALEYIPHKEPPTNKSSSNKKRKSAANGGGDDEETPKKKKSVSDKNHNTTNGDSSLGEREEKALEALFEFVEEKGASRKAVKNFRCRVTRKASDGRYDTNYYNESGRRFRSMVEVGRYLNLVTDTPRSPAISKKGFKKKKVTTRAIEAEKKKLRKELDRLRKQHTRATNTFDDFQDKDMDSWYPVEDLLLKEEEEAVDDSKKQAVVTPTNCAAAHVPDLSGFTDVPQHYIPDVLMAWDFICTFSRALSVHPIPFDDFVQALTYKPPGPVDESDAFSAPPVYLAEAHMGLLKLLLSDQSSDEWWWSTLETHDLEMGIISNVGETIVKEESDLPLIKVDFGALLEAPEDPSLTTSWLINLEDVRKVSSADDMKEVIKMAISVMDNKFAKAYLRKALKLYKTSGADFMKRAVLWLLDRVKSARPDLYDRNVSRTVLSKERTKVMEEVAQQMGKLGSATLTVTDEDLAYDVEDSDDESDDDSDDEDAKNATTSDRVTQIESEDRPASAIPDKPLPTLVDLLLPPAKPSTDMLHPHSWPHLAGAATHRILHRYKRLRNEVDDRLREFRELPRLTVRERKEREAISTSRVLSECFADDGDENPSQKAAEILCSGGDYLELSTVHRICILRTLIEASYDTRKAYEVVDSNYKQRTNAVKALDVEQRRAKREAKEKAAADEAAARQDLASEGKRNFIEDRREEIRNANEGSQELTSEEIDGLTEEDIIEFDDDIKADYDALPTPESFKKAEVVQRVAKIQEAAAFETESLLVLTMEELLERESRDLSAMEEQLQDLGGEDVMMDPSIDRDTSRAIERLRRELTKTKAAGKTMPIPRETAIETLKDAMADETVKSLRNAIRIAKSAKLFGPDEDTNGVWALDIVRDAHMELENAKHLKRVADAQKDLISKLNKCFTRTEPLGKDRFRNNFWRFEESERGHVWVEVDYALKEGDPQLANQPGFLELVSDVASISVGAKDMEIDLVPTDETQTIEQFRTFGRQEYHSSGATACLSKRHWGCDVTEASLRSVMKNLDSRGVRENELKKNLKEALEDKSTLQDNATAQHKAAAEGENGEAPQNESGEENATAQHNAVAAGENGEASQNENGEEHVDSGAVIQSGGDDNYFSEAKEAARYLQSDVVRADILEKLSSSAIGEHVRVRVLIDHQARYATATITGWKLREDQEPVQPDGDEFEPSMRIVMTPIWCAFSDRGNEFWLTGTELLESICRFAMWTNKEKGYFEHDAAFLSYRNPLGRYCGKASDAAASSTPYRLAHLMVKKEAEVYAKLKHRLYDNTWGGKNGSRNAWISSMKDYAFDFQAIREGLLTLENAFFELAGGVPVENDESTSGKDLLNNPKTRNDIELESLDKDATGLWNSRDSRSVFLEIVTSKFADDVTRHTRRV